MNLKLRFALLFTFFVAVILAISSGTIYILNATYRDTDFFDRVKIEGLEYHETLTDVASSKKDPSEILNRVLHSSTLYDESVIKLNKKGEILYKIPDTIHVSISPDILLKIQRDKEYRWYTDRQYQSVGIYLQNEGNILITTGYDKPGFEKMDNLKIILALVFFGGLLVTAFISFLFVQEAFKPLSRLSFQMKNTTLQNLTQRLLVKETKDEISEIARSYNAMMERLNKAYEFQKSFVYHASHELRTPLATMLSETEAALSREMSQPDYEKLLISLKEEQQELIDLTNSLLLISQYEEMAFAQEWPNLRIDEILYEVVSHAKRAFPSLIANISFKQLPETDSDFVVQGNESLLKSAFFNLVKNAFMYSIDQRVAISIEVFEKKIQVHIENGGLQPSISEMDKIMEPFYRGQNALKSKGFGLGLAIINRIISIHKGQVAYTALSGSINRFTVSLSRELHKPAQLEQ